MSAPPRKRARRTTTGGKASSGGSGGGGGGYKLDEKILKALRGSKHGKTTDELVASCKAEGQEVALQLNKLSSKGLVQFAKNSDGKMIIILTSADQQKIKSAMVDLSNNAQHVYQTIGEKGRDGEHALFAVASAAHAGPRRRHQLFSRAAEPCRHLETRDQVQDRAGREGGGEDPEEPGEEEPGQDGEDCAPAELAVGETVILLAPSVLSPLKHLLKVEGGAAE